MLALTDAYDYRRNDDETALGASAKLALPCPALWQSCLYW
jgi:hypothetical protein